MKKHRGLRIVKKNKDRMMSFEINFKSSFTKEEKEVICIYIKTILQTDYIGKCINVIKKNGRILLVGNFKYLINELYLSEIKKT